MHASNQQRGVASVLLDEDMESIAPELRLEMREIEYFWS